MHKEEEIKCKRRTRYRKIREDGSSEKREERD
jgi:hypothetical protein